MSLVMAFELGLERESIGRVLPKGPSIYEDEGPG